MMIKIYNSLSQFKGPSGFPSWISRITYNNALMKFRRKHPVDYHADLTMEENSSNLNTTSSQYEPLEHMAQQQLSILLEQAIDRLPDTYRTVFMMRAIQQLNTQETATSLDLTVDVIKQRFLRSKRLLRKELEQHIQQSGLSVFEFSGHRCDKIVHHVLSNI